MSKPDVSTMDTDEYAALIGIDWAGEKHDLWVYESDTGKQAHRELKQTPEAVSEWVAELRSGFGGRQVAICLEQSKGALIYALLGYEFITLYPINPATLAKYREAFSPSGAKDDPTDAELLMELLLKHQDKLRAWKPDDEQTRMLTMLNEERRKSVDLRTKLVLRLQAVLKNYFPQALDILAGNLTSELACVFFQKWSTLDALKRAKPQTIRALYYAHNYRRGDLIEANLEKICTATPLTQDKAIVSVSAITAQGLAKQIRTINEVIEQYEQQIKEVFRDHPDRFIFDSLPGAGPVLAPRLLSAMGADRDRYSEARDIQTFSGIAPVVERSGKQVWIHWRWGCPKFIRQTFHEFANCSRHFSLWANAHYELQRERGKSHHAAVRSLAFKWQRIIFRCWKERKPYDEERYIQMLKANGSPLWQRVNALQKA